MGTLKTCTRNHHSVAASRKELAYEYNRLDMIHEPNGAMYHVDHAVLLHHGQLRFAHLILAKAAL